MYDVIVIGAGVSGCAIARELSKLDFIYKEMVHWSFGLMRKTYEN